MGRPHTSKDNLPKKHSRGLIHKEISYYILSVTYKASKGQTSPFMSSVTHYVKSVYYNYIHFTKQLYAQKIFRCYKYQTLQILWHLKSVYFTCKSKPCGFYLSTRRHRDALTEDRKCLRSGDRLVTLSELIN